jgi:hypothetical protein
MKQTYLYDFSIGFWNCCERGIFFVFHFDYHALDNNTTNDDNMIWTKIFKCEKSQEKRKEANPTLFSEMIILIVI